MVPLVRGGLKPLGRAGAELLQLLLAFCSCSAELYSSG